MENAQDEKPSRSRRCPADMCVEITRSRFHKQMWNGIKNGLISFTDALQSMFINNIPSEEILNLPSSTVYTIGIAFYSTLAVMLVVVFYFTYISARSERFVSIDNDSAACEPVYRPFSKDILVDINGNWEGSEEFSYSDAIYRWIFTEFKGSKSDFANFISAGLDQVEIAGAIAKTSTLPENIMAWIAYQASISRDSKKQVLRFTGSSAAVFDSVHRNFGLGDILGNCGVRPSMSFDRGANKHRISYPADAYFADSECSRILDPFHASYVPEFDGNEFSLGLSVDSLITATAVNSGITATQELNMIKDSKFQVDHNGIIYDYASFYYPRFPGMDAVICVIIDKYQYLCTVSLGGNIYGVPVFNHFGSEIDRPVLCTCPPSSEAAEDVCNGFIFLSGIIFYEYDNTVSSDESILSILNLALGVDGAALIKAAYNATYDAVQDNVYRNDSGWREKTYEFCSEAANPGTRCSVASLLIANDGNEISDYFYPLYPGACSDSFTLSDSVQKKIMNSPPVDLTEIYEDCMNNKIDVINNSIGLTAGTVGAYLPVVVVLFVVGIQLWVMKNGGPLAQSYRSSDKQEVLDFLALNLLLARDGKYTLSEDEASIILRLKEELGSKPEIRRFRIENTSTVSDEHSETSSAVSQDGIELKGRQSSNLAALVKDRFIHKNEFIANPMYAAAGDKT